MTTDELEQIDILIARRLAASAPPTERYIEGRRVRPHATVQDGMVYMLPKRGRTLDRLMAVGVIALLLYAAWLIWMPAKVGVMPQLPPASLALTPRPTPAGAWQPANAPQDDRSTASEAPVATKAPPVEPIEDVAAEPPAILIIVTPLPAPGEPAFVESFKPAGCPMGITILDRADPCYNAPASLAPLPEPGESGFEESFH